MQSQAISNTEEDSSLFTNSVSPLLLRAIKDPQLVSIAKKVARKALLNEREAFAITQASLPVILKLIELSKLTVSSEKHIRIRPLLCVPIGESLKSHNKEETLSHCLLYAEQATKGFTSEKEIYIVPDFWSGTHSIYDLLWVLSKLKENANDSFSLSPIGPSFLECAQIQSNYDLTFEALLSALRNAQVPSLAGESSLDSLLQATKMGFDLALGQSLEISNSGDVNWEKFIDTIFAYRTLLLKSGNIKSFRPLSNHPIDSVQVQPQAPLANTLFKAISIARLLLPEVPFIRAPLSIFGMKAAHVAVHYGANDFGFGALDTSSQEKLGLMLYKDVLEVINQHPLGNTAGEFDAYAGNMK